MRYFKMIKLPFIIPFLFALTLTMPISVKADEKPMPGDGLLTCTTSSAVCDTTCQAIAAMDCPPESNVDYCYLLTSRDFTLGVGDGDDSGEPGGGGGVIFPPPEDEDSVGIPLLDDLFTMYKNCPVKLGVTDGSTPPPQWEDPDNPPPNPWENPAPPPQNPPPRFFTITWTLSF